MRLGSNMHVAARGWGIHEQELCKGKSLSLCSWNASVDTHAFLYHDTSQAMYICLDVVTVVLLAI